MLLRRQCGCVGAPLSVLSGEMGVGVVTMDARGLTGLLSARRPVV